MPTFEAAKSYTSLYLSMSSYREDGISGGIFVRGHEKVNHRKLVMQALTVNGRRIYPFDKGLHMYEGGLYHPPFDTLKNCASIYDMKLKLYR